MICAWVADERGARSADPDEALAELKRSATARVWIDFDSEDEQRARKVLEPLGIHPLVLEDMMVELNRPKVDDYGEYLYLVVHSARWDTDRPQLREIDIVLGDRWLITFHEGPTRSITAAEDVLPRRPTLLSDGPATLLHFVLDELVDHYLPIMDRIAEEVDDIEEQLFGQGKVTIQQRIIRIKRGMSALRRIVGPERDTLLALTRDEYRAVPPAIRPYLRDVYDRLARVNDLLDSFRDETASLLDLYVSIMSNRLNEVIKRLTVIATVGLPLTVVTSYYGMNFALPEYHWPHGELYVLGVLALTGFGTWFYLRWRSWS